MAKLISHKGINHITGDPQQKSAKPADPMQSLKSNYDMKPKSETYEDKGQRSQRI